MRTLHPAQTTHGGEALLVQIFVYALLTSDTKDLDSSMKRHLKVAFHAAQSALCSIVQC